MVNFNEDTSTISLSGRISSNESDDTLARIQDIINSFGVKELTFDLSKLEYISSSGLRVLLTLKKENSEIELVNVNGDIYEILEITGFNQIFKIRRTIKEIEADNLEFIGKGACGTVYQLNDDTVVKIYNEKVSLSEIEMERDNAKAALIKGINTAIPFELVKIDGKYALIYEKMSAKTIQKMMAENKPEAEKYLSVFADFAKRINSIEMEKNQFKPVKEVWKAKIGRFTNVFSEYEITRIKEMIDSVPDRNTFVHGDFHIGNVMFAKGEPILIDLADATIGHPVFDVCETFMAFSLMASLVTDEQCLSLIGFEKNVVLNFWKIYANIYFGEGKLSESMEKTILPFAALRWLMNICDYYSEPQGPALLCKKLVLDNLGENTEWENMPF